MAGNNITMLNRKTRKQSKRKSYKIHVTSVPNHHVTEDNREWTPVYGPDNKWSYDDGYATDEHCIGYESLNKNGVSNKR